MKTLMVMIAFAIPVAVTLGLMAGLVMVVIGALGHVFDAPSLFISFWEACVVVLALSILSAYFGGKK